MASFVDSLVAPLSVINALIIAVGMREKENISSTFNSLEEIWQEYNVYSIIIEMSEMIKIFYSLKRRN